MSVERWQALLASNITDEYYPPDTPDKPMGCVSREDRVAILEQRASRRDRAKRHLCGLWHPHDRFTVEELAQRCHTESGGTGRSLGEVCHA